METSTLTVDHPSRSRRRLVRGYVFCQRMLFLNRFRFTGLVVPTLRDQIQLPWNQEVWYLETKPKSRRIEGNLSLTRKCFVSLSWKSCKKFLVVRVLINIRDRLSFGNILCNWVLGFLDSLNINPIRYLFILLSKFLSTDNFYDWRGKSLNVSKITKKLLVTSCCFYLLFNTESHVPFLRETPVYRVGPFGSWVRSTKISQTGTRYYNPLYVRDCILRFGPSLI